MKIAGYKSNSFVDYPSHIASVVFTMGCNFDCWYCHNRHILKDAPLLDEEKVLKQIANEADFIVDGVVVTGGEPTLQADLIPFLTKLRQISSLDIKLDSNGSNPHILKEILEKGLVDYVAMDIKTSLQNYSLITQTKVDESKIKESINLLKASGIKHEFRTTVSPDVNIDNLRLILPLLSDSAYFLQQYRPVTEEQPKAYAPNIIKDFASTLSKEFNRPIGVRNVD